MKPEHIPLYPRYAELRKLQQYFEGKQYEGRPDFWTGLSKDGVVPLRERKPCIIYPLPKASVKQVVRFTFGEGRFPTLKVEEQDGGEYSSLSLNEEEAKTLEDGLVALIENAQIRSLMRTAMERGLSERSACVIVNIKRGRFNFDIPHAKDCVPTFVDDDPSGELDSLVWAYQYERTEVDDKGHPTCKRYWFRRDITREAYLEYAPVPVAQGNQTVEWGTPKVIPHDYGFVPAVWIRNLSDTCEPGGIDGFSLYEDLFDEFDALNFALSQRHRGITFFGTPQPYETGVEDGDGPEADGRTSTTPGYSPTSNGTYAELGGGRQTHGFSEGNKRRMSPDRLWSYEGSNVNVGLIETTGKAFEVATLHVQDIRERLLESMSVILTSMEQFARGGGDMNAKFLVLAFAPLLNLIDELRDATWWPHGLQAIISLLLRILAKRGGKGIVMPKAVELAELVKRFEVEVATDKVEGEAEQTESVWMLPKITPTWGNTFSPSDAEVDAAVTTAVKAKDGGLIQVETAAKYVAPYFGVDDAEAEVEAAETKATEAAEAAHEKQIALTEAKRPPVNAKEGEVPAEEEGEPPAEE